MRKITITLDCEETTCGNCAKREMHEAGQVCEQFNEYLKQADSGPLNYKRGSRCLEAEAENKRYLLAIKAFCEATKWGHPDWKKQDYIAALFEIAGKQH